MSKTGASYVNFETHTSNNLYDSPSITSPYALEGADGCFDVKGCLTYRRVDTCW